jgi:flagellar hook-length control protein FliK
VPAWVQQAVQAQLSGRLVAAARGGEPGAVQRLSLHLHPADLGVVQVVATMDDGTVTLQLMAGNPATREAIRASLASLRTDLAAAGLDGTRLDVSDQPPSQQNTPQQQFGDASGRGGSLTGRGDASAAHGGRLREAHEAPGPRVGVRTGLAAASQGVDLHL